MPGPTKEQLAKFQDVFDEFSDEKEKTMEVAIIERALRALKLNPTKAEVNEILSDCSKTNTINFATFAYIAYHVSCYSNTEKDLIKAFTVFDRDGTGKLHKDTVRGILTQKTNPLTEPQLENLFNSLDIDNGFVSIKELAHKLTEQ